MVVSCYINLSVEEAMTWRCGFTLQNMGLIYSIPKKMLKKSKSVVKIVEHSGKFRVTLDESVIQHWFSIEAARPFSFFVRPSYHWAARVVRRPMWMAPTCTSWVFCNGRSKSTWPAFSGDDVRHGSKVQKSGDNFIWKYRKRLGVLTDLMPDPGWSSF